LLTPRSHLTAAQPTQTPARGPALGAGSGNATPLPARGGLPNKSLGQASPAPEAVPPPWPRRLLLVDDDTTNRKLLQRLLGRRYPGCAFEHAANGEEALAKVAAAGAAARATAPAPGFDVILLDHSMPVMDGPTAARQLAALGALRGPGCPGAVLLGVTGNALVEDQAAFRAAGVHDVVIKPVSLAVLVAAVEAYRPNAEGGTSAGPSGGSGPGEQP
jgi:CheY-like chemotaxis protein